MRKRHFVAMIALFIVLVVTFTLQSKEENKSEIAEEAYLPEIKKIDRTIEIKSALNAFDTLFLKLTEESGTVGGAVAIVYKNQIVFLKCIGVCKAGGADSVDQNTVFRLASVSKTITGVLAGILSAGNVIGLDDKVVDYIPGFKLSNHESTRSLTVRNILSHTSGLVPHAFDNLVEEHVPFRQIVARLKDAALNAPPGELYAYQNVVFSLYDTITAVKTGKKFGETLAEKVFVPFHMNHASVGFDAFKSNPNKAYPHFGSKGNFRTLSLNDRYYSTAPAAGINASISDLANFMLELLNDSSKYVTSEIRETVFTPQVVSPLNHRYFAHWKNVRSKKYALGWRTVEYKNRDVAYHGGYVRGYRAEIAVCFDEDTGIAYLSNSPGPAGTKIVPAFLDLLFDLKDQQQLLTAKP